MMIYFYSDMPIIQYFFLKSKMKQKIVSVLLQHQRGHTCLLPGIRGILDASYFK